MDVVTIPPSKVGSPKAKRSGTSIHLSEVAFVFSVNPNIAKMAHPRAKLMRMEYCLMARGPFSAKTNVKKIRNKQITRIFKSTVSDHWYPTPKIPFKKEPLN